jgi:hypothetical protein
MPFISGRSGDASWLADDLGVMNSACSSSEECDRETHVVPCISFALVPNMKDTHVQPSQIMLIAEEVP